MGSVLLFFPMNSALAEMRIESSSSRNVRGNATNTTNYPVANAGKDLEVRNNTKVIFNASGSTADVAMINYTWSFYHNGSKVKLYGSAPEFQFEFSGVYLVNLTIIDERGNSAYDLMNVTVEEDEIKDSNENVKLAVILGIGFTALLVLIVMIWSFTLETADRKDRDKEKKEDET